MERDIQLVSAIEEYFKIRFALKKFKDETH